MINLPVSEAEAFDYLSIVQVKIDRGMNLAHRFAEIAGALEDQGVAIETILISADYHLLYRSNAFCFDAIERAHMDQIGSKEVQAINHQRYLAKRALQERFWPSQPLTEVKSQSSNVLPPAAIAPTVPLNGGD